MSMDFKKAIQMWSVGMLWPTFSVELTYSWCTIKGYAATSASWYEEPVRNMAARVCNSVACCCSVVTTGGPDLLLHGSLAEP